MSIIDTLPTRLDCLPDSARQIWSARSRLESLCFLLLLLSTVESEASERSPLQSFKPFAPFAPPLFAGQQENAFRDMAESTGKAARLHRSRAACTNCRQHKQASEVECVPLLERRTLAWNQTLRLTDHLRAPTEMRRSREDSLQEMRALQPRVHLSSPEWSHSLLRYKASRVAGPRCSRRLSRSLRHSRFRQVNGRVPA